MLSEALAALASSAGTSLVTAMVTDGWQETRRRVARLLGRGDAREESRQLDRLDQACRQLTEASGERAEQVRRDQDTAWRTRFADLLEDTPEVEGQLRELVEYLTHQSGAVQVNAQASGHAQQAVQGQGVQTNTFNAP